MNPAGKVDATVWMAVFPADVLTQGSPLAAAEFGALMRLRLAYWAGVKLEAIAERLARVAGMELRQWKRIAAGVLAAAGFVVRDGVCCCDELDEKLAEVDRARARKSARASLAAVIRWTRERAAKAADQAAAGQLPLVFGAGSVSDNAASATQFGAQVGAQVVDFQQTDDARRMLGACPPPPTPAAVFFENAPTPARVGGGAPAREARAGLPVAEALRDRLAPAPAQRHRATDATLADARAALAAIGLPVAEGDPALRRLIDAGHPPQEILAFARRALERGRGVRFPWLWTVAALDFQHAAGVDPVHRPPPDWRATRSTIERRASELGIPSYAAFEAERVRRGVPWGFAEWQQMVERADAAARQAAPAGAPEVEEALT